MPVGPLVQLLENCERLFRANEDSLVNSKCTVEKKFVREKVCSFKIFPIYHGVAEKATAHFFFADCTLLTSSEMCTFWTKCGSLGSVDQRAQGCLKAMPQHMYWVPDARILYWASRFINLDEYFNSPESASVSLKPHTKWQCTKYAIYQRAQCNRARWCIANTGTTLNYSATRLEPKMNMCSVAALPVTTCILFIVKCGSTAAASVT